MPFVLAISNGVSGGRLYTLLTTGHGGLPIVSLFLCVVQSNFLSNKSLTCKFLVAVRIKQGKMEEKFTKWSCSYCLNYGYYFFFI